MQESAKSRAWRACVLACFACLHAHVLTCLRCLCACVLTCLACLRADVLGVLTYLACLCAWRVQVLTCFVCLRVYVRACSDEIFYFFTCLRTWCAFLSYQLYISTLKFKNSHSKKIVCFVNLNIFLIYILILSKAISIFYNLYIHLLH